MRRFLNRLEAGKALADALLDYQNQKDVIVLGLPRGGIPVAFEVAKGLHVPLDVFLVRKLGVPGHEEFAMGAISMGGVSILHQETISQLKIPASAIQAVIVKEQQELKRREQVYRGKRSPLVLKNKTVILIDDGIATGASMFAAVAALKRLQPKMIIAAVPVAPADACQRLSQEVDKFICLLQPEDFYAVGAHYEEFDQTSDEEVMSCLRDSGG